MTRRHAAAAPSSPKPPTAGRTGRPPKTYAETEAMRTRIKTAAVEVFGQRGFTDATVEAILAASGLSRPTFYRYFANVDEVVDLVLSEVNDRLLRDVALAILQENDPIAKADAGVMAWLKWCEWVGAMLPAIRAQMHTPNTSAHAHRERVIATFCETIEGVCQALNRHVPARVLIETVIIGMEHLGYSYHCGTTPRSEESLARTREGMLRLVLGMLGGSAEWSMVPALASRLGITLE